MQCWSHSKHVQTVLSESASLVKAHQLDLTTQVHSDGEKKQHNAQQEEADISNSQQS